ncbi:MAG: AI-2E family transporter [Lachnospiraceae bacterium]|nr:AI-2E family transporter [Lachnospiraceae bacterium]
MKKFHELLEKRWFANLFVVCAGILFYLLMTHLYMFAGAFAAIMDTIAPIVVGLIIAYIIDPFTKFWEFRVLHKIKNEKVRRTIAVILALVVVLLLIVLFFVALVPSLVSSVVGLASNADNYAANIRSLMKQLNALHLGFHLDPSKLVEYTDKALGMLLTYMNQNSDSILSASTNFGRSLFNAVIGFIIGVYFLLGKKYLLNGIYDIRKAFIPADQLKKHNTFWKRVHEIFIQFIGYDLLDGFIVGLVNAIIMAIFGMPYVALISVVVGVTNLLPTFGPIAGGAVGAIILLLNNPIQALYFIIITAIIQTIDGYILKPRLFGGSFGIPAVWTLIAIILGGKMFGIPGILLAIPFAAILNILYHEQFKPWMAEHKAEMNKKKD